MNEEIKETVEQAEETAEQAVDAAEEIAEEIIPEEATEQAEEAADEADIQSENEEETIGNIKISVDVVATIAGIAASGIEGVSCMYTTFADGVAKRFGAKKNNSGVRVAMSSDSVSIDLYIVVEYGVKIPELAWSIQESVKSNVESMTGLTVEKVNIHIEGISFGNDAEDEEITE